MAIRLNNSFFRVRDGVFRSIEPFISSGGGPLTYTVTELLTTAGAGTWTKPVGITSVTVECWGGGGGGAGSTVNDGGGGGGGGGAYAKKTITYSEATSNLSYTIGIGGTTGTGDGGNGGNSTWETTVVVAEGGLGGEDPTAFPAGGQGGSIANSIGDIKYAGGLGNVGFSNLAVDASGGGGGGAGSTGDGGNGADNLPNGGIGASEFGGNGGDGTTGTVNFTGLPGSIYGGGGSGAFKISGGNRSGGAGAQGLIRVSYQIQPPLDIYTGSSAAFSVRKLTNSASFCMQVRRDSDNTIQDIGFQSDGLIDTGSLLSFVGSGTGYVVKWYNQLIDDEATVPFGTTFQSPYIVSSGSLSTMNGKPAVFYNTLAGLITSASILTNDNGLWSTYAVGQVADTNTRLMVRTVYNVPAINIAQNIRRNTTNIESIGQNTAGGTGTDLGPSNPGTSQFIAYAQRTSTNVEVYVNGATNGATTVTGTPASGSGTQGSVYLGFFGGSGATPTFPWSGSIQEVIHFPQDPTTFDYRTALTSILNSYYGTF